MSNTSLDRRSTAFRTSKIREVLPEHHLADYPNLILFLEKYYDFLETDSTMAFAKTLNEMFKYRDLNDAPRQFLDLVIKEISAGVVSVDFFLEPRFASRLLSIFHRVKGSLYSSEAFFKAFYGVEAEIQYPKRDMFMVDGSLIGPENLAIIQDGALYQIYSILIKSSIPSSEWNSLYKALVHPAGFYLGSQVVITSEASMAQNDMPSVVLDDFARIVTYVSTATPAVTPLTDLSVYTEPDSDGTRVRYDLNKPISAFLVYTAAELDDMYQTIADLIQLSSPLFDEDSDANGRGLDFTNTIERFDEVEYRWYDSA